MYINFVVFFSSHLVTLSRRQSYLTNKLLIFLCLSEIYTIQHILTFLFLFEFSFESFPILFVAVFIYCPASCFTIKELLLAKHSKPESSTNKAQYKKFSKRLSMYPLLICCVQKRFSEKVNLSMLSFQMFCQKQA